MVGYEAVVAVITGLEHQQGTHRKNSTTRSHVTGPNVVRIRACSHLPDQIVTEVQQPAVPRAGGLPFIGALPSFVHDPFALLERARSIGDVCRLELGFVDAVTVHHPDHVDHILRKHHRRYPKGGPMWDSARILIGNGLPASEGDLWRRQRRMMQPQFHRQKLADLTALIVDAIDESLEWGDVERSWSTINIGNRMPQLTMNVASAALLGIRTSNTSAQSISDDMTFAFDHMLRAMLTHRLPRWVPVPGRKRFQETVANVQGTVSQIIEQRRRTGFQGDDLLGMLLMATDGSHAMSDKQLRDEVLSFYLAGYETTSSALQWSLHFLTQFPEHLGRLREESDAVLRGRPPRFSDLRMLKYARMVVQEALRLYPSAWWLPRVAAEDDEIGGHPIAAGTMVAPITYTVHRHPGFWSQPERFDPERFTPERSAGRHPLAWCPFGAGPRKCIGQELSLMEAQIALAMLTQRYDIEAVPSYVATPHLSSTLRPADGVVLRIRQRPLLRRCRASSSSAAIPIPRSCESSSAMMM